MPKLVNRFEAEMMGKAAQAKRDREDERDAKKMRHDWRITVFNVLGGAFAGGIVSFIVSLIFWLVTKG